MCEDGGCGKSEHVSPDLLQQLHERAEQHARDRGQTVDEMLASHEPKDTIGERFRRLKF